MDRIYICGAISKVPKSEHVRFEQAEKMLNERENVIAVNPMKLDHSNDNTYGEIMRTDLKEMLTCDGIYVISNWRLSEGAKLEIANACLTDMPIEFENWSVQ